MVFDETTLHDTSISPSQRQYVLILHPRRQIFIYTAVKPTGSSAERERDRERQEREREREKDKRERKTREREIEKDKRERGGER